MDDFFANLTKNTSAGSDKQTKATAPTEESKEQEWGVDLKDLSPGFGQPKASIVNDLAMKDDNEDELANSVELSDDDAGWGADKLDEPVTAEVEMKEDEEAELSGELSEEGWGMDAGTN